MARKRKEVEPTDALANELVDVELAPEAQSDTPVEVESGSVAEGEGAPAVAPTKWVVLEQVKVSLYGQITTLPVGSVISVASYGEDGIRRIMQQNVKLEPVL